MPRTKELSKDRPLRVSDFHEAGKGYKSISLSLDVHWSGRPEKITAKTQHRMLNEVKKNPQVSAKDLHKSLAHANISVDESTIRKTLNKNGIKERTPPLEETTAVQRKCICKLEVFK